MRSMEACELAGISHRQFSHWSKRGYLGRRLQQRIGHGNLRDVQPGELTLMRHMAVLTVLMSPENSCAVLAQSTDSGEGFSAEINGVAISWTLPELPARENRKEEQ